MRILRIKGKNLASLEQFDLDFETEPLRSAGIFAIAGPTGAGKSTLLDALCVALYDSTPRLDKRGGVDLVDVPGKDGSMLGASDVRSLLRRGAASGLAEVEFVGVDGERYLARWSVKRARERAEGRLQPQELALIRSRDGQSIGGKKMETLDMIRERIGLTFDQFRRAVLLAQGEFAAFLRSPSQERAELLERMTGTEIYGEISKQAHEEAALQKQLLNALRNKRQLLPVMSQEARAELEAELLQVSLEGEAALREEEAARVAAAWHSQHLKLKNVHESARLELLAAEKAVQDALPLQTELEAVDQVQNYRPQLEAFDRAAAGRVHDGDLLVAAGLELKSAGEKDEQARLQASEGARELESAQKAIEAAEPQLREARKLDTMLEAAEKALASAEADADVRTEEAIAAAAEVSRLELEVDALSYEAGALEGWRAEHLEDELLADNWSAWKIAIQTCESTRSALAQAEAGLKRRRLAVDEAERALTEAKNAETAAQQKADETQAEVVHLEALADEIDGDTLAVQRDAVEAEGVRLDRLKQVAGQVARARSEARQHREKAQRAQSEALEATRSGEAAQAEAARLEIQRAEAEQASRRIEATIDLADRRHLLKDDEPCPLCGAIEHPWAERDVLPTAILEEQQLRVKDLEARLVASRSLAIRQDTLRATWEKTAEESISSATLSETELATFSIEWLNVRTDEDRTRFGDEPEVTGVMEVLQALAHENQVSSQNLRDRLKELEARRKAATDARRVRDTASAGLAQAQGILREAHESFNKASTALQLGLAEAATQERLRTEALVQLEPLWTRDSALQPRLLAEPAVLRAELQRKVLEWEANRERDAKVAIELRQLGIRVENANAFREQADKAAVTAGESLAGLGGARDDLLLRRNQVLEGTADEVEQSLRETLTKAQTRAQALEKAANEAARHTVAVDTRFRSAQAALEASELLALETRVALDGVLAELGLELEVLHARLSHGQEWLRLRRSQLDALARKQDAARQACQTRAAELAGHEALIPAIDAQQAEEGLADAQQRRSQADVRKGELRLELSQDDSRQAQALDLDGQIRAREVEAEAWLQIDGLIGSKDGKVFRQFAQRMTLDLLVGYANRHLADLAPRYRLQRVPSVDLVPGNRLQRVSDAGMELQIIDQDMGNEIRSLNTLSGGETFLVSLALALGLASLASGTTRIESLFIDEGFGSLDPETLDLAISVLDGLQATGRKVGVISHVPGLAERLGVQVRVRPRGGARSAVEVMAR